MQDLKEFSHVERDEPMRPSDLHKGLESTLNIVWNDLKYKAKVEKHYGGCRWSNAICRRSTRCS